MLSRFSRGFPGRLLRHRPDVKQPDVQQTESALYAITICRNLIEDCTGTGIQRVRHRLAAGADWRRVLDLASPECAPALEVAITALLADGISFERYIETPDASVLRVSGATAGLKALVAMWPTNSGEAALYRDHASTRPALSAVAEFEAMAAVAPIAVIRTDGDGVVCWQNAAAEQLTAQLGSAEPLMRDQSGPLVVPVAADPTDVVCLDVSIANLDTGGTAFFIRDLTPQYEVEQTLKTFMATLTDTFADLDTGLAVFDRHRVLNIFNPAISALFRLDPVFLAGRPTIREFLDAIRSSRMMPEQMNYSGWRDEWIGQLTGPRDTPFEEDWHLPNGQVISVRARLHAKGAIVVLFEDISTTVSQERRHREEMETGQLMMDRLGEGICVFSSSGQVIYSNPAFVSLLRFDPFDEVVSNGMQSILSHAIDRFGCSDDWQAFREYALSPERSDQWCAALQTGQKVALILQASALPDGSTMLVVCEADNRPFRDLDDRSPGPARPVLTRTG